MWRLRVFNTSARLLRVGYFVPSSYSFLTSLYPWDSAAVWIVFMGAAPARATPSPTSRRGSLYAPSHAPGDLYSDPLSPMSPPSL